MGPACCSSNECCGYMQEKQEQPSTIDIYTAQTGPQSLRQNTATSITDITFTTPLSRAGTKRDLAANTRVRHLIASPHSNPAVSDTDVQDPQVTESSIYRPNLSTDDTSNCETVPPTKPSCGVSSKDRSLDTCDRPSSCSDSQIVSTGSSSCCAALRMFEAEPKMADGHTDDLRKDPEQGPSTFERIALTINDLKCSCCDSNISHILRQWTAIKNPQVNLVLARVEFELDTSRLSVEEAILQLSKATGYTLEKYDHPEGQVLELLVTEPTTIFNAGKPYGVNLVECDTRRYWCPLSLRSRDSTAIPREIRSFRYSSVSEVGSNETDGGRILYQQSIRIHYDAASIGARKVFEYYQRLSKGQQIRLAPPRASSGLGVSASQVKGAFWVFIVAIIFTMPVLVLAWTPIDHTKPVYAHVSLALATIVQAIASKEFFPGVLKSFKHRRMFDMDFLIALSSTTAYVFSVVSYVFKLHKHPLETGSFFESSTLLVTLIFFGRVVNELARFRAAKSISFRSLQAEEALLVISGNTTDGATHKIDTRLLQYGDYFKVPPHARIVTDGHVVYGGSEVNESMITGESIPVAKGLGHKVYAGTTNGPGQLIVRLTALPHENSVSKIATMVENAELTKPKTQALADRIASWFVPTIALIGLAVFLIWIFVGKYHLHRSWGRSVVNALTYAIATIIVSCPCAIAIAVPMVVLIAGGVSARFGIILRNPEKLEVARNVTDIVFDKTGTLTTGSLTVVDTEAHGHLTRQIRGMIMGILKDDKHPVAAAVYRYLDEDLCKANGESVRPQKMVEITSIPGYGIRGLCKDTGLEICAGSPEWLGVKVLESQHTVLSVTIAGELRMTFRLGDQIRKGAKGVVEALQDRGINVHMISGDCVGAVDSAAHQLGISKSRSRARMKPADKQTYIQDIQSGSRGVVIFCGDGTNDSVALKQADIGVHINHGSDVAKGASDVIFMTARLHNMLILLDISKAAYRRILFNFAWSGAYNIIAIAMAAGAFVKIRIPPQYAALGELVSVIPVILIAFQVRWRDYGKKYRAIDAQCKES